MFPCVDLNHYAPFLFGNFSTRSPLPTPAQHAYRRTFLATGSKTALCANVGRRLVVQTVGVAAARAQRLDGVDDNQEAEQSPEEEAEGDGGLERAAEVVAATAVGPTDGDGERDGKRARTE